jgi:hypothetical protein
MTAALRMTTAITTLDYCTSWFSLHAAHIGGRKERATDVIAAHVRRQQLFNQNHHDEYTTAYRL